MKTLMISSAIVAAIAASALSANAQVAAPAAPAANNNIVVAQNTNPLLRKQVLSTSGTVKAVASNTGDDDSNERGEGSEGGEGGEGAGGDND